jgi:hypothetical protein
LGLNQDRLLVGDYHWLVQALHQLVGVAWRQLVVQHRPGHVQAA